MTSVAARHLGSPGLATGWLALALALGAQAQAPAAQMPNAPTPPAAPVPTAVAPAAAAAAPAVAASAPAPKPARKVAAAPSPGCSVAEFRTLALDTHTPLERSVLATQWLLKNGPGCSEDQILMIRANRALWLGVADTVAMMGLVDRIVEARQSGRPDALQAMYAAPTPDRVGTIDVQRVNGGLRPVVPPAPAAPPMVLGAQVQAPAMAPARPPAGPSATQ